MLTSWIANLVCAALCLLILRSLIEAAYDCLLLGLGCLFITAAYLLQALAALSSFAMSGQKHEGSSKSF